MIKVYAILLWLLPAASFAAGINISEKVQHYTVSGASFAELRRDMAARSGTGFWGFTEWQVSWTARCQIDVVIRITLPRLSRKASLSSADRRIWRAMVSALERHERMHAEHARRAAREIRKTKCQDPRAVIAKWEAMDRALDQATNHGATQGVSLPN